MTAMQYALDKASGLKTPLNPSRRAIARVRNPLPAPITCPHCGAPVEIVNNAAIYGRSYGDWPWAYACDGADGEGCGAYVGMHPFTAIPLGTLADEPTREARKKAKAAFNPIWQGKRMSRTEAYRWLADALSIANVEECHIGWFDVKTCERVVRAVENRGAA